MSIINVGDFFDFDNHNAVNRIAYTEEDAKYKLQYIKAMQDLGMKISIDNVGNICGEISGKYAKNKNLVMGSHTDSVKNGGQFDGPVGVYMALKAIENYKNSNSENQYGNLKAVIYACEESTRFSTACIGSYYLNGEFDEEYFDKLKDVNGVSFSEIISDYKGYIFSHLSEYRIDLNNIELVDKVLTPEEVSEAIESHIEQSEVLFNSNNSIGIIDSIGKPVRGKITVHGDNSIVTSAKIINDLTNLAIESKSSNSEEAVRITVPRFDTVDSEENMKPVQGNLFLVSAYGENNHSGATPMDSRKDSVLGLSKLILELDRFRQENPDENIQFLGTITPKWGANQIQDKTYLLMQVESDKYNKNPILESYVKKFGQKNNINIELLPLNKTVAPKDLTTELFVDVRQQYPVTPEETKENLYNIFKNIQEQNSDGKDSISFEITSQGTPMKTSTELLENIEKICKDKNYPCQIMHSWPGHDLACILPENNTHGKRILFFIPSQGGSHNPKETTSKEAIEIGTDVYSTLILQRMNKIKDDYNKEEVR